MAAIMFKKPKRNFRKKERSSDGSDNESEVKEESPTIETKNVIPEKKKKSASSVLSFEVDEDCGDDGGQAEFFKVKKSNASRRISKQIKKEKRLEKKSQNGNIVESENDTDEDEKAVSGKKKIESEKKKKKDTEEEQRKADEKIKKLREEFRTMNGDEAEAAEMSDDDDGQIAFKNRLARGEIPDSKMIHYIRKQRQMARNTDFIPLKEEEKPQKTSASTARLVRDDDNDKSDDDEDEERIDFSVNQAARDRQRLRDNFLAAEHGSDEDSDQEREWEAQQIKKATSLQIPGVEVASYSPHRSNVQVEGSSDAADKKAQQLVTGPIFGAQDSSEINIESVRKKLQERLSIMDSVYRTHKLEHEQTTSDLLATEDSQESCQSKVSLLENRYRFFQELRGYVRDLIDCLNEKVPILQDLEQRINNLLKARANRLLQRRQQDVQDQCRDYMTNKSRVKMDEDTREQQARQRRVADREARRSRRRRLREDREITGHHNGFSSDEEESSQSQVLKFNTEMDDIITTRDNLFDDVVADFADIEVVKEHFERWKFTYTETYQEAYIGLCLPKMVNPFIRRELLTWNPLDDDCVDFEKSDWFNVVVFMGYKEGTEMMVSDDDCRILPSIVEKVLIPKLTFLVENVWDPMSARQSSNLVEIVTRLVQGYPTIHGDNKNVRALIEAVVSRLKKTLDDDVFMPMYPLSVLDNRLSGPAVFFHRQSWSSIKLLGNMLNWHQILSESVLKKLAFSGLLNRYIVVGLVSSHINRESLQKCQVIISSFPKEWFASLEGDTTLPELENLCRYLVGAAETLHKASVLESGRQEGRDLVKQISKHLVNIHAMDHAVELANKFSVPL